MTRVRRCRVCGCTDDTPCRRIVEGAPVEAVPCSWISTDLCSSCSYFAVGADRGGVPQGESLHGRKPPTDTMPARPDLRRRPKAWKRVAYRIVVALDAEPGSWWDRCLKWLEDHP